MSGKKSKRWRVKIHRLVKKEDSKGIDSSQKEFIKKHAKKKLSKDPESYGEPLRGEFKKYWKLVVGNYRVIYRIHKDSVEVLVIKVGIRRDEEVYEELFLRLKKMGEI